MVFHLFHRNKENKEDLVKKNLRFQKLAYRLGNIFFTTPWYDFEKADLKHSTLNKVCAVVYGMVLGVFLAFGLVKPYHKDDNIFERILSTLDDFLAICLTEYLVFASAFIKQRKWEIFLKKFSEMQSMNENNVDCTTNHMFYLQFVFGHIYFLVTFIYSSYGWFGHFGKRCIIPIVSIVVPEYYCFLYALVASNLVLFIRCFYEDLNRQLERHTENYLVKSSDYFSEEKYVNSILNIGKHYRSLSELVHYFNNISGPVTLLLFSHTIIQILRCANMALRLLDMDIPWTPMLSLIMIFILCMGESTYIILCCEQASLAGKELKRLCHKLQEHFHVTSRPRKELFKLADIVRSYKPQFTAANFFVINQGTILGIINIATTYLIVIIQFDSTVREKYSKKEAS